MSKLDIDWEREFTDGGLPDAHTTNECDSVVFFWDDTDDAFVIEGLTDAQANEICSLVMMVVEASK